MSTVHKGFDHHLRTRGIRALITAAICIIIITAAVLVANLVIIPQTRYNNALDYMNSSNYIKAVFEFTQLDDYKDSLEKTVLCMEKIYGLDLSSATTTSLSPWFNITNDGQLSFDQTKYNGDGNIIIPEIIDGIIVTAIAEYGFSNSYEIINIEIPDTVTVLHEGAFYYCTALHSVALPSALTDIGENAFFSNMSLKSVDLPRTLSKLGISAFENCANLESVSFARRLILIPDSAFKSCASLKTVYFAGTQDMWNEIFIAANNESILNSEIIFKQ